MEGEELAFWMKIKGDDDVVMGVYYGPSSQSGNQIMSLSTSYSFICFGLIIL